MSVITSQLPYTHWWAVKFPHSASNAESGSISWHHFAISLLLEAVATAPRQIHELDDIAIVAIQMGPDYDFPNAYMHLQGKFHFRSTRYMKWECQWIGQT